MRILVTGASGFVGQAICEGLLAAGHNVIGLHGRTRDDDDKRPYEVVVADISNIDAIKRAGEIVGSCDAIIHAAACLSLDLYSPEVINVNCLGVQNMLWLATRWRSSHFIFLSSIPVIGVPRSLPINEEHPTLPPSTYHAAKLFGEHLVRLAANQDLNAISLRIPAPVGPGMPMSRFLSVLVKRALKNETIKLSGHGTRQQNYIDVRDIAQAILLCLQKQLSGVFNIASESCISNIDLALRVIKHCRSKSEVSFNGIPDIEEDYIWDVSTDKAKKELGFVPEYQIEDAVDIAISDHISDD